MTTDQPGSISFTYNQLLIPGLLSIVQKFQKRLFPCCSRHGGAALEVTNTFYLKLLQTNTVSPRKILG